MAKEIWCAVTVLFGMGIMAEDAHAQSAEELDQNLMNEASILMDADTGQILYEKNADEQMYPASITKIITGILAIEEGDLSEEVKISEHATEQIGTRVYLLEDEEMPLGQLVAGLLINSGNDAGTAIAEHLAGSEEAFANEMNDFVEELGATNTHFTNPHGLYNEDHYTTAEDMAKITQYAMQNDVFKEIVSTKEMDWVGEGWETTLYNHHRLLWDYDGTIGVKNGFVNESGFTLVTGAERDGQTLIAVTLKNDSARQSYEDTQQLLDYGFNEYEQVTIDTDKPIENEAGNVFYPEADASYTIKKELDVKKTIVGNSLVLQDSDSQFLREIELVKEKERKFESRRARLQQEQLRLFRGIMSTN